MVGSGYVCRYIFGHICLHAGMYSRGHVATRIFRVHTHVDVLVPSQAYAPSKKYAVVQR